MKFEPYCTLIAIEGLKFGAQHNTDLTLTNDSKILFYGRTKRKLFFAFDMAGKLTLKTMVTFYLEVLNTTQIG
jgi:hypothetical protein